MEKIINIGSFIVSIVIYAVCRFMGIDMFIPLWAMLALLGLLFLIADGIGANLINKNKGNFMDVSETEINHAIELRRKAAIDPSKFTTWICYIGVALLLCLIHCYIF